MSHAPVIALHGVSKRYRRVQNRSLLGAMTGERGEEVVALADLDLDVGRGETVGVLGHNGAGKTTLLRLLAGVTSPSDGRVSVTGRVTPLISVGVGFHPELSGHENMAVNGSVLGLSRRQLGDLRSEIIDFSGLSGDVLDSPVKFYSSGMLLRLAFSMAIHTSPDILLVDELLAVGDIAFQQKCLRKMAEIRSRGVTLVLVSHSVFTVREVCDRAIVISNGRKVHDGDVAAAIDHHQQLLAAGVDDEGLRANVRVVDRRIVDEHGRTVDALQSGERYELRCRLLFSGRVVDPHVRFTVYSEDGAIVYQMLSAVRRSHRTFGEGEEADLRVRFQASMNAGTFHFTVQVLGSQGRAVLAHDVEGAVARVERPGQSSGLVPLSAAASLRRRGPTAR